MVSALRCDTHPQLRKTYPERASLRMTRGSTTDGDSDKASSPKSDKEAAKTVAATASSGALGCVYGTPEDEPQPPPPLLQQRARPGIGRVLLDDEGQVSGVIPEEVRTTLL